MIIDTHCHYNLEPLSDGWQSHWKKARTAGVGASVVVGTTIDSSTLACKIAGSDDALLASVGVHPTHALETLREVETPEAVIDQLKILIRKHEVSAIGECGLDYFRLPKTGAARELQLAAQHLVCKAQLELAGELHLPLIIHLRDKTDIAYDAFLKLYTQVSPGVPTILHCVSGPSTWLTEMLKLGVYVGIAGNISYRSAEQIRDLFSQTPPDRIVLETDAPYLPPQAHRGDVCEPYMISETAAFIRDQLDANLEQVQENSLSIFPQLQAVRAASEGVSS